MKESRSRRRRETRGLATLYVQVVTAVAEW
jgi:hypothetical protein